MSTEIACARATDFKVEAFINHPGNKIGIVGIYWVKPEEMGCPDQKTDLGQPLPVRQKIALDLDGRLSWVGSGQQLQNPVEVPNTF